MNKESFIKQTAKDYDMNYSEVYNIFRLYPDKFYEKLEEKLKERRNK